MRRLFPAILLAAWLLSATAQTDTVTLEQCYRQAMQHFPLARQKEFLQQTTALEVKKLNAQYMPQLALNMQATWQSDVPNVPIDNSLVQIPIPTKDQYKGTVDVNQMIYDGSAVKNQKAVQSANSLTQQQNVEVQLYQLKTQVSSLYFSVLLSDAQMEVSRLLEDNVTSQLEKVQAAVDNGISIASNADVLKAELIRTKQQQAVIRENKQAALSMLSELTGLPLSGQIIFPLPQSGFSPVADFSARPEYGLFHLQQQTLEMQRKAILSKQLPRIFAFAQGGVGRPGLNLLDPDFAPLFYTGLKLSWSPWHWNEDKYNRQIVDISKLLVDNQREVFDVNSRLALLKQSATIQSLLQQLSSDKEIIALREDITKSAAAQLDNGIITSTDYLTELRAEQQARLNLKTHEIQLEQAKAEYLLITGK